MTEKSSRRTFVKGVAATTSLAALGGQAAAQGQSGQGQGGQPTIEDIQSNVTANQAGQGLVVLQVGGVSLNALNANNVQLFFNDELIDISDVEILTADDDLVQIVVQDSLNDLIDIFGNTVNATVSILGGAVTESETLSLVQQ
ncbi:twin-arginine translocation signal domain-containing protein [Haloterrigena salinisoli]|uniref:twin-arginine translocation signal domain-containing protein n=1 Tax=Haloterrigena salinisoli TaxID=3132747 RepID=UPI0030D4CBC2